MNSQIFLSFLFLLCPILSLSFLKISKSKFINIPIANSILAVSCNILATQNKTSPSQANLDILGSAAYFAVIGGPAVVNTGFSKIFGSVATTNNFVDGVIQYVAGGLFERDNVSQNAQNDLKNAYYKLLAAKGSVNDRDLAGQTLTPGVYSFSNAAFLSANLPLNLDARGDPNARWIFQIDSALIVKPKAQVIMKNGGSSKNVYWQVGSAAIIQDNVTFMGNILAKSSVNLGAGSSLYGRVFAIDGAVILDSNNITSVDCQ